MKVILQNDTTYILRFDRGEEAITGLIAFCNSNSIKAGYLSMIGASSELILSYYNLHTKEYEDHEIVENLEVVGITGNIATLKDETMVHAHGTFADQDLKTIGGHVKLLKVSATLEVVLNKLPGEIRREFDEPTGLNLMS